MGPSVSSRTYSINIRRIKKKNEPRITLNFTLQHLHSRIPLDFFSLSPGTLSTCIGFVGDFPFNEITMTSQLNFCIKQNVRNSLEMGATHQRIPTLFDNFICVNYALRQST